MLRFSLITEKSYCGFLLNLCGYAAIFLPTVDFVIKFFICLFNCFLMIIPLQLSLKPQLNAYFIHFSSSFKNCIRI